MDALVMLGLIGGRVPFVIPLESCRDTEVAGEGMGAGAEEDEEGDMERLGAFARSFFWGSLSVGAGEVADDTGAECAEGECDACEEDAGGRMRCIGWHMDCITSGGRLSKRIMARARGMWTRSREREMQAQRG
jgi:hypothetical protein